MALHFDREEFESRRRRALEAMAAQGLDALLMFKQERVGSWPFLAMPENPKTPGIWSNPFARRSCEFLCFPSA